MLYNELMESVTEFYENESNTFMEGVNAEISKKAKTVLKDMTTSVKEAKTLYREEKYDEAISKLDDVLKNMNDVKAEIEAIDITWGSAVIGFFYQSICSSFKASLLGMISFGIGSVVSGVKDVIDILRGIADAMENEEDLTPKVLNVRRAKIVGMIKNFEDCVKKLQKEIKNVQSEKMKEEEKKEEEKKEEKPSVESVKLSIFESCHAGEITEEERDTLLSIL